MTESLEGSSIGRVYVANAGHQRLEHSWRPHYQILVQFGGRRDLEGKMIGQGGDAVMVAFG
jgi:hypothetical protein